MRVLVTGADGFIAKNLITHMSNSPDLDPVSFTRDDSPKSLQGLLEGVEWVFHLAGVNRSRNKQDFRDGNSLLTHELCEAIKSQKNKINVVFASSIHAGSNSDYGLSKLDAERCLLELQDGIHNRTFIYRLPNVFGKWARPNYNSVVATFCHNLARGLPIHIHDPSALLRLVYIDDLINSFIAVVRENARLDPFVEVMPEYKITVGELAQTLQDYNNSPESLLMDEVGVGLKRALYSTFVSYLPAKRFSYKVREYIDSRGIFVEMLKTKSSGQFSFFTALPGVTRGGHYHHSKTEKFLVIRGKARFNFKNLSNGDTHQINVSGESPEVVESVPGWFHDITNIGENELICMLWANEVFNPQAPDTFVSW